MPSMRIKPYLLFCFKVILLLLMAVITIILLMSIITARAANNWQTRYNNPEVVLKKIT
jgi:hypothetical protein